MLMEINRQISEDGNDAGELFMDYKNQCLNPDKNLKYF